MNNDSTLHELRFALERTPNGALEELRVALCATDLAPFFEVVKDDDDRLVWIDDLASCIMEDAKIGASMEALIEMVPETGELLRSLPTLSAFRAEFRKGAPGNVFFFV